MTHDALEPLVEFYDTRHAHTKDVDGTNLGQFVIRYCVSTIASDDRGLCLHGAVPEWNLTSITMNKVREFIAPLNPLQYEHNFTL